MNATNGVTATDDVFLGVVLWKNTTKGFLCLSDLAGATYICSIPSGGFNGYMPTPSDIILFGIVFGRQNHFSRADYTITNIESVDPSTVVDSDLTALTKTYAEFQTKEEEKHQKREAYKQSRKDEFTLRGRPELYGITPLKSRWADD